MLVLRCTGDTSKTAKRKNSMKPHWVMGNGVGPVFLQLFSGDPTDLLLGEFKVLIKYFSPQQGLSRLQTSNYWSTNMNPSFSGTEHDLSLLLRVMTWPLRCDGSPVLHAVTWPVFVCVCVCLLVWSVESGPIASVQTRVTHWVSPL